MSECMDTHAGYYCAFAVPQYTHKHTHTHAWMDGWMDVSIRGCVSFCASLCGVSGWANAFVSESTLSV